MKSLDVCCFQANFNWWPACTWHPCDFASSHAVITITSENGPLRKRSSRCTNLKTPALSFNLDRKDFKTELFEHLAIIPRTRVVYELISLRRRQSNPLVYTVCVLVHDILFQIPLSRKDIYSRFWLVKTTVLTRQKQANQKRLYIYPCDSAEFEIRYRALIRRR